MEGKSLSERLREAALERARLEGQVVDSYVLDSEGVIDLRELEQEPAGTSVTQPAAALAETRGMIGEAAEVGDLYDETFGARRWPFARREAAPAPPPVRTSPPEVSRRSAALTNLSTLPLAHDSQPEVEPQPAAPAVEIRADEVTIDLTSTDDTESRTDDDGRPIRACPSCGATGRRDLFDRFSQIEFYSCDDCHNMWQVHRDA